MKTTQTIELLNSALNLHNQGSLDAADQIYQAILKDDNKNFDANHLHGLILSQKEEYTKALPFLELAVKQNQNSFEANNNLGLVYKNLKEYSNAEKYFLKAISIDKNSFKAYLNCANLYMSQYKYNEALDFLFKCNVIKGNSLEFIHRIGEVYNLKYLRNKDEKCLVEAKKFLKQAIAIEPQATGSYQALAMTYLWLGEIKEADKLFKQCNSIIQSNQKNFPDKYMGPKEWKYKRLSDPNAVAALMKHEFEQLTFIENDSDGIRNMKFSRQHYDFLKNNYVKIKEGSFQAASINDESKKSLLKQLYNKPPKCHLKNYVNLNNNISELERRYTNSQPEVVVIDNFLSEEALLELQKFCHSANIFKYPYTNGYIGAFLARGLANEYILELSEAIRKTYKNIFTNSKLGEAWIFKYDSSCKGIRAHADDAKVNLNFWITPKHANLNPSTGGLIIWNKFPDKGDTFVEFNAKPDEAEKMLKEKKIDSSKIAYKENRAVIFNSMLYHATDSYEFGNDYKDRRLNITFLYN